MKSNTPKIHIVEVNQPNLELIAKGILIATRSIKVNTDIKKEGQE